MKPDPNQHPVTHVHFARPTRIGGGELTSWMATKDPDRIALVTPVGVEFRPNDGGPSDIVPYSNITGMRQPPRKP